MHNWQIQSPYHYNPEKKDSLENLIKSILKNRGITKEEDIESFLHPDLKNINLSKLKINLREMDKAVIRIKKAVKNRESIIVYTDYDVDGIVSGAIIWETLYKQGANIMPYVPNRFSDGYGLSKKAINKVRKKFNPSLIFTVDHGITAVNEISYARKMGIDTIVIDHHLIPAKNPNAHALIHSTMLTAAGLTWIFVNYLTSKTNEKFLDIVALATVADMIPLINENRILVTFGLEQINKTRRLGLNSLIESSGLAKGEIDTFSLSHILAPRLNASGRMEDGLDSLRLLCTKDKDRADELAQKLNSVNRSRQLLTKDSLDLAHSKIKKTENLIFVESENFHQGIIGLIAGKLVEKYNRPAIVVSINSIFCKASARSVKGINIVELIKTSSAILVDVGGHPMAAGFTVRKSNLKKLKENLLSASQKIIKIDDLVEKKLVDLELDIAFVNEDLYRKISSLVPFGQGNPQPLFVSYKNTVVDFSLVGREKNHLKLTLASAKNPEKLVSAIAFNFSALFPSLDLGTPLDIIYQIEKDNWHGLSRLILKLKDVRLTANSSYEKNYSVNHGNPASG
ncbi:single-stranded-DNA-specific exonuclease RecJ [Candidatus Gottesmanbacteria bacterium RBG_16_37_8]|uniref:Single-stranded-DNA-specific exonuclease RecJ n=1 Tax=Candidatus Gottesmanbacteria bacterium RBG_16_37_8 TaxID=1798371 RepID=A0A1F5YRC3_9BACT|nr:MAG: single-stranded-DNA-specific exonuclease RecJ [Candidatus Gottesmanbacteria bacterium RBG_16_37_8]